MFLTNAFRQVMRRSTSPRRRQSPGKPARQWRTRQARLELEPLEDRLVPSGEVLFYRVTDGLAVTGHMDAAGTYTDQQAYSFPPWTMRGIVGVVGGEVLVCYALISEDAGYAFTGHVDAAGTFTEQQIFRMPLPPSWADSFVGVGGGEVMIKSGGSYAASTGHVDAAGIYTHQQWVLG